MAHVSVFLTMYMLAKTQYIHDLEAPRKSEHRNAWPPQLLAINGHGVRLAESATLKNTAAEDPNSAAQDGDSDRICGCHRAGLGRGHARGAPPNCSARPRSSLKCHIARLVSRHHPPGHMERAAQKSPSPVAQPSDWNSPPNNAETTPARGAATLG